MDKRKIIPSLPVVVGVDELGVLLEVEDVVDPVVEVQVLAVLLEDEDFFMAARKGVSQLSG